MSIRTKIFLSLAVMLAIAVAVTAAAARRHPILVDINPDPGMVRPRNYCLMNPFRDRTPERAAVALLRELRSGNVAVLDDLAPHLREAEKQYPIRDWRVGDRDDLAGTTELMYWVERRNYDGIEESVHLMVRGKGKAARVVHFSAVY